MDVGCGLGAWLAEFQRSGVTSVWGLDGAYVEPTELVIAVERFRPVDLSVGFSAPKADLVVCLEVAEHLPASSASAFVASLCDAAPVVLFSAAAPGQQGVGHVNEQWPEYWANLFDQQGFGPIDCLRDLLWDDERVSWWYRQNMIFFVRRELIDRYPRLAAEGFTTRIERRSHRLHPTCRWEAERRSLQRVIVEQTRPGTVIVVTEGRMIFEAPSRTVLPFLENGGVYWGRPSDDESAISELQRMMDQGAEWLVLASTALWWLDAYPGFATWLHDNAAHIADSEGALVFSLMAGDQEPHQDH